MPGRSLRLARGWLRKLLEPSVAVKTLWVSWLSSVNWAGFAGLCAHSCNVGGGGPLRGDLSGSQT